MYLFCQCSILLETKVGNSPVLFSWNLLVGTPEQTCSLQMKESSVLFSYTPWVSPNTAMCCYSRRNKSILPSSTPAMCNIHTYKYKVGGSLWPLMNMSLCVAFSIKSTYSALQLCSDVATDLNTSKLLISCCRVCLFLYKIAFFNMCCRYCFNSTMVPKLAKLISSAVLYLHWMC